MSTGENIKRIRNIRGMTQKELGIAIGIGEESASPRMAQYETGNRTPTKSSGRRDGKEEEVIFNGSGLATYVAGPFLLKKVSMAYIIKL